MGEEIRTRIVSIGLLMYQRKLTDSSGGNISARDGDLIYLTPKYAGAHKRWKLELEDINVLTLDGRVLEGRGAPSREKSMHLGLYRTSPKVGAVIHAHPEYPLVFAAAQESIPPATDLAEEYGGTVDLVQAARAGSEELAQNVIAFVRERQHQLDIHAIPMLLPKHGVAVAARDLDEAFSILEMVDTNAKCLVLGRLAYAHWK